MFIRIYNILIRILYPLVIKRYINKRKQNGKEDLKRFNERMGRPQLKRPDGKLIWLFWPKAKDIQVIDENTFIVINNGRPMLKYIFVE